MVHRQAVMYPTLFLLWSLVTGCLASRSVLIADKNGIHIMNETSGESKPVLSYSQGANSVQYDLDSGYIYGILESNQATAFKIIRTKVLDSSMNHTCTQNELPKWCKRDSKCLQTCNSSNPYKFEQVLNPDKCMNASNLVLDWINKNIYWTCLPNHGSQQWPSTLNMATLEGSNNKTILSRPNRIKAVVINPLEGFLFVLEFFNILKKTTLEGKEDSTFEFQFDDEISDISLDTKNKLLYVVGKTRKTTEIDGTFIGTLDYERKVFNKLLPSVDPELISGHVVISNGVIFWLTQSKTNQSLYRPTGDAETYKKLKTKKIYVEYEVKKCCLVDVYAQRSTNGSVCSKYGCPNSCTITNWMQVTCTNESESESLDYVGSDTTPPEDATVGSRKATDKGAMLVTSSSDMTLFFTVVFCIWFSICVVVIIAKRRAKKVKKRNYKPSGTQNTSSTFSF